MEHCTDLNRLRVVSVDPMKLAITVKDKLTKLYVDGVLVPRQPNYSDWGRADIIIIPADTKVIAVEGCGNAVSSQFRDAVR